MTRIVSLYKLEKDEIACIKAQVERLGPEGLKKADFRSLMCRMDRRCRFSFNMTVSRYGDFVYIS
jgi:hypothetical protein